MKLVTKDYRGERIESIPDHFSRVLESDSEDSVSRAQKTAENASEALGRLVEILAHKGQLTAEEIVKISGASTYIHPTLA